MSIEERGAAYMAALAAEEELEERVRLLALRAVSSPPPWALAAAHELRILAGHLLHERIMEARERGWSWGRIARVLGISRQALHRREAVYERLRRATDRAAARRRATDGP
jgi:hypothetical protein